VSKDEVNLIVMMRKTLVFILILAGL